MRQATSTPASARRPAILAAMQDVMGPLPGEERRVPLDLCIHAEERLEGTTRLRVSYAAEPGDRVPAHLFLPQRAQGPVPGVLCLHQTTTIGKDEPAGLGGLLNLHYALELAQRGLVALAPDYPGFGDNHTDAYGLGYASTTMKAIWNHMRGLDLLQSLAEVQPDHLGCLGHSLGGHNTLFLAAFDERVRAAVTSCGFNSFRKYYGGDLTGWSHRGYMPRIADVYGRDAERLPFDFPDVLVAIAPRALFVNAPLRDSNFEVSGVHDCLTVARPVYEALGAEERLVAAFPDAEHDFPPAEREQAYRFLEEQLA
ncbi:MAG: prolyl oligopeptidase family serine peptidase [Anaerolineae bacterium]|nr:prolyl oligopeptidase family serine peptidase [Anaerolineae bacterium]